MRPPVRLAAVLLCYCAAIGTVYGASPTPITRAEAIMIIVTNAKIAVVTPSSGDLIATDVATNAWYARYIAAALRTGIITPDPYNGTVSPESPITRGDFLAMMGQALVLPRGLPHHFTDITKNAAYAPFAGAAEQYGLFRLSATDHLDPEQLLTPVEAASAMRSLFVRFPGLRTTTSSHQKTNGTRSVSVQSSSIATVLHEAASSAASASDRALPSLPAVANKLELQKLQIIALVNHERSLQGLPPLARNRLLEDAAQKHASDMRKRGYFSHYTPEGLSYVDRIRKTGYFIFQTPQCACQPYFNMQQALDERSETAPNYIVTKQQVICTCKPTFAAGENLAKGQTTPEMAVQDWMASPPHRRSMLQSAFEETGIGIDGDIWVQTFGSIHIK